MKPRTPYAAPRFGALLLCLLLLAAPGLALADAPAATLLVEASSLQTIQGENADAALGVAGLAKLPAVLTLCEAVDQGVLDPAATISVSDRAAAVPGPTAFIERGEQIAAGALLKAACMICAGDAIAALGEALCGSESAFVERVNARLAELGIPAAVTDAAGSGLSMSAAMLATLGRALMQSPAFCANAMLTLDTITHPDGRETELVNANRMLRTYAGCTGVATGSSQADGYCGVFAATRGDTAMLCVVLGAKNANERFDAATAMLDYAFATIKTQRLAAAGEVLRESVRVQGGVRREVNLVAKDTVVALLDKAAPALQAVEDIPETLTAPVAAGEVLGSISYQTQDGVEMARVELVAQHAVEQASYRDAVRNVLLGFLRL